ncbi:MAG: exosortase system-associated protein, TIGR04073 family [Candidatus Omnitrophota bacterium]
MKEITSRLTRLSAVFLIMMFISGISARPSYGNNALTKLGRGFCNVTTCYLEIMEQSVKEKEKGGSLQGMTTGLVKGVAMTAVRLGVGVFEIATFPFPVPKGYKPILTDPENFFVSQGGKY